MNREVPAWEKSIHSTYIWKGTHLHNIKNSSKSIIKRQPNKNWGKVLDRHYRKEDIGMANKWLNQKCSASLVIRENAN